MEQILPHLMYVFVGIAIISAVLAIYTATLVFSSLRQPKLPEPAQYVELPSPYMDWRVEYQVIYQYEGEEVLQQGGSYYEEDLTREGFEQAWAIKAHNLFNNSCLYRVPVYFEVIGVIAHPEQYKNEELRNKFRG